MRHSTKILGTAIGVTGLLLLGWPALRSPTRDGAVALLITTNVSTTRQSFFTASLTNNTASAIGLDPLLVQLEDEHGLVLNGFGENWADKEGKQLFILPPKGVAFVSPQADSTIKRIRIVGEYSCDASFLPRLLSRGISILPLYFLPRNLHEWLVNAGLVDGRLHRRVESSWMLNNRTQRTLR